MKQFNISLFIVLLVGSFLASCKNVEQKPLVLNALFSDHMVLQQNDSVSFWGNYSTNSKVSVKTSWGEEMSTSSNDAGHWRLKVLTPKAGGPYTVNISTKNSEVNLNDILIGEVWIASGQSNMEMPLTGYLPGEPIDNYKEEIANANYPNIRMFTVKKNMSLVPQDTISGNWKVCTPEVADSFSATGYFFARKLQKELNIPIGIIHSSWGGTVAEAWISKEGLQKFPEFIESIKTFSKNETKTWAEQFDKTGAPTNLETLESINMNDAVMADPAFDDTKWLINQLPLAGCHTDQFIPDAAISQQLHGYFWYRKKVFLDTIDQNYTLTIGAVDDADVTYFNGHKIGATWDWQKKRVYAIPKDILRQGENTIAIKQYDGYGASAILAPIQLESTEGDIISLAGDWKCLFYADGFGEELLVYGTKHQDKLKDRPLIASGGPNDLPASLYNAMLHPLIPYTIKGVIWYQGESNVGRAKQYEKLFPAMITDWRTKWNREFPFYYVQIAPFDYGNGLSPALRDAQRLSLKTPNTGMAITMDIGLPKSIHPGNKQDVGNRLALLALVNDYNKEEVASGPLYKNHTVFGNKIILEFDFVGGGLMTKDGVLNGFEIAGKNNKYVSAKATIVNDKIEVSAKEISSPLHVRYGWKDYIDGSLFNTEGLPSSSFVTKD